MILKSYPITTRRRGETFSGRYELEDGLVRVFSAYGSRSAFVGTSARVTAVRLLDEIVGLSEAQSRRPDLRSGRR
jgi:hypothetical protein